MWKNVIVIGIFCAVGLSGSAYADATSARLDVAYSGSSGELSVTHRYDGVPATSCFLRFRATIYYEGGSGRGARWANLGSRQRVRSRVQRFTLRKLPGVVTRSGKDPILTLQSKTYCPSGTFVSGARARFVVCGVGSRKRSPDEFLRILSQKLSAALRRI